MTKSITQRQKDVFDFLVESFRENDQIPPTHCIAEKFKFASLNAVVCHMNALQRQGFIEKNRFGKFRFTRNPAGQFNLNPVVRVGGACKVDEVLCGVRLLLGDSIFAILNREYAERYVPYFNESEYPKQLLIVDWPGTAQEHAESWKLHAKGVCKTIGVTDIWSNT